jgi:Tol biopolymer transport system component
VTDDRGVNNYGRWSRDGRWIVFQSNRYLPEQPDSAGDSPGLERYEIYLVRRDGMGLRRLTRNAWFDGHPSW